jgi:radial spoke head protein 3
LSDYENMVNEAEVEPDFFIDRPPTAIYVPDSPGHDKSTVLNDRQDPDLFDFNAEVEPILQVLIGKSLELSKIEVIEEYEHDLFVAHKKQFKMLRESELIIT